MNYSAPLDGIRAIAILAVLIFHVAPAALPGGFVGVDVFFVLSGFLITSVILLDIKQKKFGLLEFYLRRLQRLVPNAVLMSAVTVALWRWLLPPSTAINVGSHSLWTTLNLSNFFIWKQLGGYWGDAAATAPLLHTWSLAVEEQFYFVFPGTLLLLARYARDRILRLLVAVVAASFVVCLIGTYRSPTLTFYMLPTRVWELLLGSVLAAYKFPLDDGPQPLSRLLGALGPVAGWLGLGLIATGCIFLAEGTGFPGLGALLPTVGTALVILAVDEPSNPVAKLLSHRAFVEVGKLSYSIYLWHWPLIVLGTLQAGVWGLPVLAGAAAGGMLSLGLAVAAYHWVEAPLRQRGPDRARRLAVIGAAMAATLAWSAYVSTRVLDADPDDRFDPVIFGGLAYSVGQPFNLVELQRSTRYRDVTFPEAPPVAKEAWRTGGIVHSYGGGTPKVVVLGSSHALMFAPVIDEICKELNISVAFLCADGTPLFFHTPINAGFPTAAVASAFDAARKDWLRSWHPKLVIGIDRWDLGTATPAALSRSLEEFLAELAPLTNQVALVTQVPVLQTGETFNAREFFSWRQGFQSGSATLLQDRHAERRDLLNQVVRQAASTTAQTQIIAPDQAFLLPDGSIRATKGRAFLYADDDHLSQAGASEVRSAFAKVIQEALR